MDIKKLVELQKEFAKVYEENSFAGINPRHVHLLAEDFLKEFTNYTVSKRIYDHYEYPYELSREVDGVLFIAIMTEEAYQKLKKEEVTV